MLEMSRPDERQGLVEETDATDDGAELERMGLSGGPSKRGTAMPSKIEGLSKEGIERVWAVIESDGLESGSEREVRVLGFQLTLEAAPSQGARRGNDSLGY